MRSLLSSVDAEEKTDDVYVGNEENIRNGHAKRAASLMALNNGSSSSKKNLCSRKENLAFRCSS